MSEATLCSEVTSLRPSYADSLSLAPVLAQFGVAGVMTHDIRRSGGFAWKQGYTIEPPATR